MTVQVKRVRKTGCFKKCGRSRVLKWGRDWKTLSLERLKRPTFPGCWEYNEGQSAEVGKKCKGRGLNGRFRETGECGSWNDDNGGH